MKDFIDIDVIYNKECDKFYLVLLLTCPVPCNAFFTVKIAWLHRHKVITHVFVRLLPFKYYLLIYRTSLFVYSTA